MGFGFHRGCGTDEGTRSFQGGMDGGLLTKFDADAEYLDEDMDFTFEDFEMPETFSLLAGMQ